MDIHDCTNRIYAVRIWYQKNVAAFEPRKLAAAARPKSESPIAELATLIRQIDASMTQALPKAAFSTRECLEILKNSERLAKAARLGLELALKQAPGLPAFEQKRAA